MSGQQEAKKARYEGRVVLNVGGTKFSTSTTTLASSSAYFQRLFSEEWWGASHPDGDDEEVFVDQDPEPFRVLLSYMRIGKVDISDLTLAVLLQAQFLHIERLLAAVRIVARRSAFASGKDTPLMKAVLSAGILSTNEVKREIASLAVYDPREISFSGQEHYPLGNYNKEFVVVLNTPDRFQDAPDFTTFIDGLNWLHHNGFTKFEEEITEEECDDAMDGFVGYFYLSRIVEEDEDADDLAKTIVDSDTNIDKVIEKRQFAAIISFTASSGGLFWIEAYIGRESDVGRRELDEQSGIIGNPKVDSRVSRLTAQDNMHSNVDMMNWLQKEGYSQRELELGDIYCHAFCTPLKLTKNKDINLSLWSRKVQE